jgi:hypothetical protein
VGSPTAFADRCVEKALRRAAEGGVHGLYIPAGALWGAQDLAKMADIGSLHTLTITMKKHPSGLKLTGELKERLDEYVGRGEGGREEEEEECVLYSGSVRGLAPLAPNNVNTMAAAAIAAHTLGFDGVCGRLVADKRLSAHVITIEATGPPPPDGSPPFSVFTTRSLFLLSLSFFLLFFVFLSAFLTFTLVARVGLISLWQVQPCWGRRGHREGHIRVVL